MSPDRLIEQWAKLKVRLDGDGLGYAGDTSIARAMRGHLSLGKSRDTHLPRHVDTPGLHGYIAVERTLRRLRPQYRATLEAVYVRPTTETGRGLRQIAKYLGVTVNGLTSRLSRFKKHLQADGQG